MSSGPSDARDAADPAAAPASEVPLELTNAQMNTAYDSGHAVPFAQGIPWLVRYREAWWVGYEGGWLRIIDQPTADSLDQRAALLTGADVDAARTTAIRGALADQGAVLPGGDEPPGNERESHQ